MADVDAMTEEPIADGDGPLWKVSYRPASEPGLEFKPYQMFWAKENADVNAAFMRGSPSTFSDVEVSFPHFAGEDKGEWIAIEDLSDADKAELQHLIAERSGN